MEDASEPATPRRLEKARQSGDVPLSRELVMLAALGCGLAALAGMTGDAPAWLAASIERAGGPVRGAWRSAAGGLLVVVAPCAAAAAGAALATLGQTGFLMRPAALAPDLGRISPARGIQRLLGAETLVQAARALAKVAALGFVLWRVLEAVLPRLGQAAGEAPAQLLPLLRQAIWQLALPLLGLQAAIAVLDLAWVRFRHGQRLRMTRQQVRDEHREAEGNPQVKQRMRQVARARARRRMMASVPKAAVVVTNPTHYAVALAYERGSPGAPRVVAKGVDELAARIREAALAHRVPIVANPPLARALYPLELETEIPAEHFRAVAEIVAYVWRLRAERGRL